jgi:hypothetical protein
MGRASREKRERRLTRFFELAPARSPEPNDAEALPPEIEEVETDMPPGRGSTPTKENGPLSRRPSWSPLTPGTAFAADQLLDGPF